MKFHHIGIATKDIEKTLKEYEKIHDVVHSSDIIYDAEQDSYLAYVETNESLNIEYIAGDKVKNFIEKGISFYHVCYTIENKDKSNPK